MNICDLRLLSFFIVCIFISLFVVDRNCYELEEKVEEKECEMLIVFSDKDEVFEIEENFFEGVELLFFDIV